MGRKCCVPDCNSNYDAIRRKGQSAISTFKFPVDAHLRDRWIRAVNRSGGWQPGSTASICINHFQPEDILRYAKPAKLKPDAVPAIFGAVLKREGDPVIRRGRPKKATVVDCEQSGAGEESGDNEEQVVEIESVEYLAEEYIVPADDLLDELILDFDGFKTQMNTREDFRNWRHYFQENVVHFYTIDDGDPENAISIENSIKIYQDMTMVLFLRGVRQNDEMLMWILGHDAKIGRWSQFETILQKYNSLSHNQRANEEYDQEDCLEKRTSETDKICDGNSDEIIEMDQQHDIPVKAEPFETEIQEEVEFLTLDPVNDSNSTVKVKHSKRNPLRTVRDRHLSREDRLERKNVRETMRDLKNVQNKCFICGLKHDSHEAFERHLPQHMSMLPFRCDRCVTQEVVIKTLASLNKHFLMHLKPLKCRKNCDVRFSSYGTRLLHEQNSHDHSGPLTCEICGKVLQSQRGYQHHLKTHTHPESMKCQLCGKQLSSSYELKLHMRVHTKEKPNKCPFCAASFNRISNLVEHKRRYHCKERPFVCDSCGLGFRSNFELKRHAAKHDSTKSIPARIKPPRSQPVSLAANEKKNYHCAVCDKPMPTATSYHSHMRKHQKKYQCSYCGLRVCQLRDFIDHENTHTGNRPYECKICSKRFKTSSTYYGHLVVHSSEKRFSCEVCGRRFSRLRHMKLHSKTHLNKSAEKPYSCNTCGKTYSDRNSFKRHVEFHVAVDDDTTTEQQSTLEVTPQQQLPETVTVHMPQDVTTLLTEIPHGAVTVALAAPMTEQIQLPQIVQTADGRGAILLSAELVAPQNIIILQQPTAKL